MLWNFRQTLVDTFRCYRSPPSCWHTFPADQGPRAISPSFYKQSLEFLRGCLDTPSFICCFMRWLVGFLQDNLSLLPAWGTYKFSPAFKTKIISNNYLCRYRNDKYLYPIKSTHTTHFSPMVAQGGRGSVLWQYCEECRRPTVPWLQCGQCSGDCSGQAVKLRPGHQGPGSYLPCPCYTRLTPTQHNHGERHNQSEPLLQWCKNYPSVPQPIVQLRRRPLVLSAY